MKREHPIEHLLAIMARLRDPKTGCPWDVEQDFASIAPYTIEEAYEVADAIARQDLGALREELGDLLFQVVFHARIAEERGAFDFHAVATALADKMIARHPHVFGDAERRDARHQTASWEEIKAAERARKKAAPASALDEVPLSLPALARAQKIQQRAGRVGFDWKDPAPALEKVVEETAEVRVALAGGRAGDLAEEIGDLLFAVVNVARLAGVDAETALRNATGKFDRRFRAVEAELARRGRTPETSDLGEMDAIWDAVKKVERSRG